MCAWVHKVPLIPMTANILAFDTATNACTVALQVGAKVYARHEIAPSQHAKLLLPLINDLLSEAKINLSDLNAVAFGCGPGSFMGVRLATATAQGLAFGLNIPLISISTLQILAQTAGGKMLSQAGMPEWTRFTGVFTAVMKKA